LPSLGEIFVGGIDPWLAIHCHHVHEDHRARGDNQIVVMNIFRGHSGDDWSNWIEASSGQSAGTGGGRDREDRCVSLIHWLRYSHLEMSWRESSVLVEKGGPI
jgi:hypothetical protein